MEHNMAGLLGAKEEKKWADLTPDERIERLRWAIENNKYLVTRIMQLEQKVHDLRLHTHDASGEAVLRIERIRESYQGQTSGFNTLA